LDVGSLATQIEGLHVLAATFLKNPTLKISPDEAKKLAVAVQNVTKQYNLNISPTLVAWFQLAGVSAAIYGPRIAINIAVRAEMKKQAKERNTLATAGNAANGMSVASSPVNATHNPGPEIPTGTFKFQ